ncbi:MULTISPECIES: hypothetical protein [unclassified Enterococcus]|uniref:hypothetical protein n=1 Tax=unclassified Enterococcus TaxID=2608891 RepID=UPI0019067BCA|nr:MULTISPECIES: hypothetical protein [unclassified Enterococcus]MBK0038775.1 hypothetical protein [Enterococcus sp. S52]MBK0071824.1 hypothetical protein [Enterococcus sp. S53]MBK0142053.1 hypothetical protein [Enterococcus sp. S76]MBK0145804.1 hypothetical protein [Enterococcus sp. S77]
MEIIYPSLIEEAYRYNKKFDPTITKVEIYQHFYQKGLINENGEPTFEALEMGYVKDYTEDWDITFAEFLSIYPVFEQYNSSHFKMIEHFWEMHRTLQIEILEKWENNRFTEEEMIDLTAFFEERLPRSR